jgi:hypothetical protein
MSSHAAWDAYNSISGTKYVILNGLRRIDESVPFEIVQHLSGEGAELARECYMVSVAFARGLVTFIDMFYLDMCNAAGFKETEAWDLTTAVVVKIFTDLRDARSIAQDSTGATGFVWGTLQAHMVMARFHQHDFSRDPGLNAILVQFILRKRQSDATTVLGGVNVKALELQVKRLEREVSTMKAAKS